MMMTALANKIRNEFPRPIVGIVGSTHPTGPYSPLMGLQAGRVIREFCLKNNGSMFVGGVGGVGVDIQTGVALHDMNKVKPYNAPQRGFFLLVPKYDTIDSEYVRGEVERVDYEPPSAYAATKHFSGLPTQIVRAGDDMYERRLMVGAVADILVVLSGSIGTFHEITSAINKGIPIISIVSSGGTAAWMTYAVRGDWPKTLQNEIMKMCRFDPRDDRFSKLTTLIESCDSLPFALDRIAEQLKTEQSKEV